MKHKINLTGKQEKQQLSFYGNLIEYQNFQKKLNKTFRTSASAVLGEFIKRVNAVLDEAKEGDDFQIIFGMKFAEAKKKRRK